MASAQLLDGGREALAAVRGFDFTLEARWTLFVLLQRKNCQPVTDYTGGKEAKSRGGKVTKYLSSIMLYCTYCKKYEYSFFLTAFYFYPLHLHTNICTSNSLLWTNTLVTFVCNRVTSSFEGN